MEILLEGCTWNSLQSFHFAKAGQSLFQVLYISFRSVINTALDIQYLPDVVYYDCTLLLKLSFTTFHGIYSWYDLALSIQKDFACSITDSRALERNMGRVP